MTGILLLSKDNFYADLDGSVAWGPQSDKEWVRDYITDKVVFVGENTWDDIQKYPLLLALPKKWVRGEPTEECEVHFGGIKAMAAHKPRRLIIHRTRTYLGEGLEFECTCGLALKSVTQCEDYTEEIYDVKERWKKD